MADALDRFAKQQRILQGAARDPEGQAIDRELDAALKPSRPRSTDDEIEELESAAINSVLKLSVAVAKVGEDQQRLVRALRTRRVAPLLDDAIRDRLADYAARAMAEAEPLALKERVRAVANWLNNAWLEGVHAATIER